MSKLVVRINNLRYRVKTTESGKKVRLAFRRGTNKVVEAKNLETGDTKRLGGVKPPPERKR